MGKQLFTTEKLLSWIIGLISLIAVMVGWIYVDNKKAQERQNDRLEAMILKIDDKFTNHCKTAETRLSAIEDEMSDFYEPPKRKKKSYRALTE